MHKRDLIVKAAQAQVIYRKQWAIRAFSVAQLPNLQDLDNPENRYPYALVIDRNVPNALFYLDPDKDLEPSIVEGYELGKPLYGMKEVMEVHPDDLPNVTQDLVSTYGRFLVNALVLVYAFGNKVQYMNSLIKPGKIDDFIARNLIDDPAPNESVSQDKIHVFELVKYSEALGTIAGLAQLCVPAATEKTMTIDPAIIKRRDELLEQYKDKLKDPAVIAMIEKELVDMDKASFKGDPGAEFFYKSKSFEVSRKKMFILYGTEQGFGGGDPVLIRESLKEGWNMDAMPAMVDATRAASYNRGHQTALGGEEVKNMYRIFQNTRISMDDCQVKAGLNWTVTAENFKDLDGRYQIVKGLPVKITLETAKAQVGQQIEIRTPMLCKAESPNFCAICVGDSLALSPNGLHTAASDVGSTFMNTFMKAMHGKVLQTVKMDLSQTLT